MTNIKKSIFFLCLTFVIAPAENRIRVYEVPYGEINNISNKDDIQRLQNMVSSSRPVAEYHKSGNISGVTMGGGSNGVEVSFRNPKTPNQNLAELLEIASKYADKTSSRNKTAIKKMLKQLKGYI